MNRLIESVIALWVGTLLLNAVYYERYPNAPRSLFAKVSENLKGEQSE